MLSSSFLNLVYPVGYFSGSTQCFILLISNGVNFTTTCRSEWTVLAIGLAASVRTFGVALTIGFFALEKEFGSVAFGFGALVIIIFFIENKTFPLGFVLPEVGNISVDIFFV